jgi:hypothetical protein
VFFGRESSYLALKKERRWKEVESRVLRRKLGYTKKRWKEDR